MSSLAVSQIEKHFMLNQIYKRSKRYFDVSRLNSIEHYQQKQRRKPSHSCKQTIQNKLQLSFISSQEFYNQRRLEELSKLKKKSQDDDEVQTNYSYLTKSNLKTFDMEKLLPRQFFTQKKQTHGGQNQFDNYFVKNITKPKGRSFDFSKFVGRKDKNLKQSINPQKQKKQQAKRKTAYELNKEYEKIVFNEALFKCLFSDTQQLRRGRNSQKLKLKSSMVQSQLDVQSVQKGRKATSKNAFASYYPFYQGKGKQQLSQMHMKCIKTEISKKDYDFQVLKRKQDMILKRMEQIKEKKIVHQNKDQMCSQKFFRRYKHDLNIKTKQQS